MISAEIIKIASDTSNCGIKKNSGLITTLKNKSYEHGFSRKTT